MWGKRTLIHCWWEGKLVQPLWKSVCRMFRKFSIDMTLPNPLLGIYQKEIQLVYEKSLTTLYLEHCNLQQQRHENKQDTHKNEKQEQRGEYWEREENKVVFLKHTYEMYKNPLRLRKVSHWMKSYQSIYLILLRLQKLHCDQQIQFS